MLRSKLTRTSSPSLILLVGAAALACAPPESTDAGSGTAATQGESESGSSMTGSESGEDESGESETGEPEPSECDAP